MGNRRGRVLYENRNGTESAELRCSGSSGDSQRFYSSRGSNRVDFVIISAIIIIIIIVIIIIISVAVVVSGVKLCVDSAKIL